jgi:hypothetical protein
MDVADNVLTAYLRGTEWASDEAIARALQHFDKNAKKKVCVARRVTFCSTDHARSLKGSR